MNKIAINSRSINRRANDLMSAAKNTEIPTLTSIDEKSTISANRNAQEIFRVTEITNRALSEALELSAGEIKAIGDRFLDLDQQAASRMGVN